MVTYVKARVSVPSRRTAGLDVRVDHDPDGVEHRGQQPGRYAEPRPDGHRRQRNRNVVKVPKAEPGPLVDEEGSEGQRKAERRAGEAQGFVPPQTFPLSFVAVLSRRLPLRGEH
jgi:hypothetical protein